MGKARWFLVCVVGAGVWLLPGLGEAEGTDEWDARWAEQDLLRTGRALSTAGTLIRPLKEIKQQRIVIDIPGIETQGESRPTQWGPVLIGSDTFARHNLRHAGAFGTNMQQPEPGTTTPLPHEWTSQRAGDLLAPVLADVRAGKNAYVKIDQNMKVVTYLTTGKPGEGKWAQSIGDWLAGQIRQVNPNADLILNAHSKGTLDAHGMDLSRFNYVVLASDRASVREVQQVIDRFRNTRFTVIAGDRDFAHGLEGFMKLKGPNVTVINLKSGGLLPTTVHGQVTDPRYQGTLEVKTPKGIEVRQGNLGGVVTDLIRPSPVRQYWVWDKSPGFLTVSNTMASMAAKSNPQRVLLVGDEQKAIQAMKGALPAGTDVKVIPFTDPARIQREAEVFRANAILGVRPSPDPPMTGPVGGSRGGSDRPELTPGYRAVAPPMTYTLPTMPQYTQSKPAYTPPVPSYTPPPQTSTPSYTPPPRIVTPPPTYTPPPRISPPSYTPPPRIYTPPMPRYTPPPSFRR